MSVRACDSCRGCGSKGVEPVLSLGEQYLTGFPKPGAPPPNKAPLELLLCNDCHLVQLKHSVPATWLYTWYGYKSGMNQSMRTALQNLADDVERRVKLKPGDIVVDIGSNDSTYLRSYRTPNLWRVGFEPAENLQAEGRKGIQTFIPDFFRNETAAEIKERLGPAKVISCIAVFYDLADPATFLTGIYHLLDDDGLLVIQMNYLGAMVENTAVDNVSHEHVCYYSLGTLWPLLRCAGFVAIDVEENDVNGGSFRIWCAKEVGKQATNAGIGRVVDMMGRESQMGLGEAKTYREFATRAHEIVRTLRTYVSSLIDAGKKIYVYGASTRGLVLMQYCGFDSKVIAGAAERNPEKWGRLYSGTGIPCVPEDAARDKADYLLVLPYQFIDEFVVREQAFLERGGSLIVPLPEPRVIDKYGTRLLAEVLMW